ncbi:MAG: restriction endonuclease [Clostridia bacterium]|nr:restriction endonuclease [Clostridia bacterium]
MINRKRLYKEILTALGKTELGREELIRSLTEKLLNCSPIGECPLGPVSELRGAIGALVDEMTANGVLKEENGTLRREASKPLALRAESCEKELIALLSERSMTRQELRGALEKRFGTDRTASKKDDSILHSLIGHVIKRLTSFGLITLEAGEYRIAPEKRARLEDISEMLALKSELLARIHAKGGEFFEHYILTLLSKHLASTGKTITECYVTGGSADGGIDGIIKTVDSLGFREHLMIQAKNRLEMTNETAVRGFYGAVCAAQGTRGIFATTSDFHPAAAEFLDGIDNCVGVNADMIFRLACECQYGVKRREGSYIIDTKLL